MEKVRINKSTTYLFVLVLLGFFCLMLSPVPAASQSKPIELKFGHIAPPFAHGAKYGMEPWTKMLEKATHNKIKFTMYPAQSLFKARDAVTAVESGLADVGHFPIGYFTGRFNLIEVITLPFLLSNPTAETASKIIYDLYDEFPEMQKDFSKMKLLIISPGDAYFFGMKNKPIRNMNDLKGLKIRVIGKWPSIAMKSLGVNPVMIPMPGLYEATAKGVIDGGLIFNTMVVDLKIYEVLKYWTDAPIYSSIAIIAMNLDKWNSLPPDVRQTIDSSERKAALNMARNGFDASKEKVAAAVKKTGKPWTRVELDPGEFQRMKEKIGRPVWDQWAKDMEKKGLPGKKVLERALELVKKYQ
jgi:TRAP-type C4-dicarboxylate transport system substrate-binding protein